MSVDKPARPSNTRGSLERSFRNILVASGRSTLSSSQPQRSSLFTQVFGNANLFRDSEPFPRITIDNLCAGFCAVSRAVTASVEDGEGPDSMDAIWPGVNGFEILQKGALTRCEVFSSGQC